MHSNNSVAIIIIATNNNSNNDNKISVNAKQDHSGSSKHDSWEPDDKVQTGRCQVSKDILFIILFCSTTELTVACSPCCCREYLSLAGVNLAE